MATKTKKTEPVVTNEIVTGYNDPAYSGYTGSRLENPDEILATEGASDGIAVYDKILRDGHVYCEMQKRVGAVTSKEYEVIPASDKAEDVRIAEFVKAVLDSFLYDKACGNLLMGNVKGFSVGEIMWEISEGDVWISNIKYVPQRRIGFDKEGGLRLLTKNNATDGEPVPLRKFQVVEWGLEAVTPYGNPLGNKLYWPWWFKKHGIKWWLIFLERFAQPTPWGKYPPGTQEPEQKKLLTALKAIQTNSEVITPEGMLIEFLEASRTGRVHYGDFTEAMDAIISKVILGGTLTTTPGDKGARSLGEVHERVMDFIVKADADDLCAQQNRQMIRWLVDYNFPGVAKYPKVWRKMEKETDLNAQAERDVKLVKEGGLKVGARYFYDTYNIPEPGQKDVIVSIPSASPSTPAQFSEHRGGACPVCFAEGAPKDSVDHLSDRLLNEADIDPMIGQIEKLAGEVQTLEELRDRLLELYGDMDPTDLGNLMQRAFTTAELAGRYEAAPNDQ